MQKPQRPRGRGTRSTTACTECQRRKQKCDQGQPCENCTRRFPEVVCEYGPRSKRSQIAGTGGVPNPDRPTFIVRPFHQAESASKAPNAPVSIVKEARRRRPALVVKWSGVDLTTEYPVYDSEDDRSAREAGRTLEGGTSSAVISYRGLNRQTAQQMWRLAGPVDAMASLPIPATKQNAMLIHTFSKLLHHFKGSFDGISDSDNPFITDYVPFCVQSPLLSRTSLYISARSLTENQHIDQTSAMKLKGDAINTLNKHLQSQNWTNDDALAGVVQFVSIEWFFGGPEVVQAHLRGLREMIRLRGGFSNTVVGALVTKVALVDDAVIAMSLETVPILKRSPEFDFEYREHPLQQLIPRFRSPLLDGEFGFFSEAEALGLHPTTAAILDDMKFLVSTVLQLGPEPLEKDIEKLQSTAMWIHDRISSLPMELPAEKFVVRSGSGPSTPLASLGSKEESHPGLEPRPHSLLPQYPSYTSSSPIGPQQRGPKLAPLKSHGPIRPLPDHLYSVVRVSAPLYARAIGTRMPFSAVCSPTDALALLNAAWRVPLPRWRGVIGILLFAFIAIVPTASIVDVDTTLLQRAGFIKGVLQIGFMQMAVESWEVCRETLGRAEELLSWLRGGKRADQR